MPNANRIYKLLLRLYPARFHEEFAGPLERQFADDYRDAPAAGGRALCWLRVIQDLLVPVPLAIARETAQDMRYAARVYRSRWLAAALAFTALALGIGAITGVFSVLNAVLLRSLPFADPARLVELQSSNAAYGIAFKGIVARPPGFAVNGWPLNSNFFSQAAS